METNTSPERLKEIKAGLPDGPINPNSALGKISDLVAMISELTTQPNLIDKYIVEKHKQWVLVVEIGFRDVVTKEEAGVRLKEMIGDQATTNEDQGLISWSISGFTVVPEFKD